MKEYPGTLDEYVASLEAKVQRLERTLDAYDLSNKTLREQVDRLKKRLEESVPAPKIPDSKRTSEPPLTV